MISPRCHLLLRHDIYDFTEMPSFVVPRYFCSHRDAIFYCATIFLFSPRCLLLLRHDISDFTAMLSCVAPRYFVSTAMPIFLKHHDTFRFAQTPFAKILLTSRLCGAGALSDIRRRSQKLLNFAQFEFRSGAAASDTSRLLGHSFLVSASHRQTGRSAERDRTFL